VTRPRKEKSADTFESEVKKHIHKDMNVTPERVKALAKAPRQVQLQVLAELRAATSDQSTAIDVAVIAVAFSLVGLFIKPVNGTDVLGMHWLVSLVVFLPVGAMLAIVVLIAFWGTLRLNKRQRRAHVWLGAYEDELERSSSRPKRSRPRPRARSAARPRAGTRERGRSHPTW
jgi:hypothetical protein